MVHSDLEITKEIKIRCPTMMASKQVNMLEPMPVSQMAMTEKMSEKHCGGGQR